MPPVASMLGFMKAATFTETVITGTGQIITVTDGFVEVNETDPEVARALADFRLIPESVSEPESKVKGR